MNSKQYGWWMMMPHASFQELLDMDNQVMLLLHSHWIALSQIMAFIYEQENAVREKHPSREETKRSLGFIKWLQYLNKRIDCSHRQNNIWPMWVYDQLEKDLSIFGRRD